MKKLYTYIITSDNGKSPCYTDNKYSLACCKPQIRRMIYKLYKEDIDSGNSNIWIMGVRRDKENNNQPFIVYLANITKVISLKEYYDSEKYSSRDDCKYRNLETISELPIAMDGDDMRLKEYFPNLKALKGNEHAEFDNIDEFYKLNKNKRKNVMKDICGRAVLLSDRFIHFSQVDPNDKYALTEQLKPIFEGLLHDYKNKNMRCFYGFDLWDEFDREIHNIYFNMNKTVKPLDVNTKSCCNNICCKNIC